MRKFSTAIMAFALLAGCSTDNAQRILSSERAVFKKSGLNPDIGSTTVVEVGGAVLEQFEYDVHVDSMITESVVEKVILGKAMVPEGERLRAVEAANGSKQYCSTRNLYIDPVGGPYDIVCFADDDNDRFFEKLRVPAAMVGQWQAIESPVAYQQRVAAEPVNDGTRHKADVTYQGLSDGILRLTYREYADDVAQPHFSQSVESIYSGEATVVVAGAKIEVHKATSNQLTYTVIKGFDGFEKSTKGVLADESSLAIEGSALVHIDDERFSSFREVQCKLGRVFERSFALSGIDDNPTARITSAKSLTVDAGPTTIYALCVYQDTASTIIDLAFGDVPNSRRLTARFDFVAKDTHSYAISARGLECVELLDVTDNNRVLTCEPLIAGRDMDLSTGKNTAVIEAEGG